MYIIYMKYKVNITTYSSMHNHLIPRIFFPLCIGIPIPITPFIFTLYKTEYPRSTIINYQQNIDVQSPVTIYSVCPSQA